MPRGGSGTMGKQSGRRRTHLRSQFRVSLLRTHGTRGCLAAERYTNGWLLRRIERYRGVPSTTGGRRPPPNWKSSRLHSPTKTSSSSHRVRIRSHFAERTFALMEGIPPLPAPPVNNGQHLLGKAVVRVELQDGFSQKGFNRLHPLPQRGLG